MFVHCKPFRFRTKQGLHMHFMRDAARGGGDVVAHTPYINVVCLHFPFAELPRCRWEIKVNPGQRVIGQFTKLQGFPPEEEQPCTDAFIQMGADLEHQMSAGTICKHGMGIHFYCRAFPLLVQYQNMYISCFSSHLNDVSFWP